MKKSIFLLAGLSLLFACGKMPVTPEEMKLDPVFPGAVKATASGFESGDRIGVFITKYNDQTPTPLQIAGNWGTNLTLSLNGSTWSLDPKVYWEEGKFDIYGYYPKMDLSSVDYVPFRVAEDQTTTDGIEGMSNFEKSDFLWAKASGVSQSASVPLTFHHKMCKVEVKLVKSEDYEGDIPEDVNVYVHNTVTLSAIDLSTGDVVKDSREQPRSIRARKTALDSFEAIVVPQRLSNRVPLVEIICGQISYLFESTAQFKSGTVHTITITLSDNPEKVAIDIGGQIENWG